MKSQLVGFYIYFEYLHDAFRYNVTHSSVLYTDIKSEIFGIIFFLTGIWLGPSIVRSIGLLHLLSIRLV